MIRPEPQPAHSFPWRKTAMVLAFAAAAIFAVITLRDQWTDVRDALSDLDPWAIVAAVVAAAAAITASAEQQRHLLMAWSSHLPRPLVLKVFYASQLGKYLPGSAWAYVAQIELARDRGIERRTSAFAIVLGAMLTVLTAFVVGGMALDVNTLWGWPSWLDNAALTAAIVATIALLIRPTVVDHLARWLLTRLRRSVPTHEPSARPLRVALAWSGVAWVAYGLQLWVLCVSAGLSPVSGLWVAVGGFAASWLVGFLVFFVPAGIGVREAVMVSVLTGAGMPSGSAIAISLVSRFVIVMAEVLLAVPAMAALKSRRRSEPEDAEVA